ncbi:Uncharacterised protein [Streptococcus constellatus]|uniref:Uncharacterized protein n=1 Tax=Streptococcus constellatus TaxID=76860 RepID=A0A564TD20_STRCV|nr:hypothetical protein [Streptococcus constellatus]VUX00889.1 Uncharacterised protein [Streptococcus gordonii]VUX05293.1 Uncharacterised protein [Streptococcus constellatus]
MNKRELIGQYSALLNVGVTKIETEIVIDDLKLLDDPLESMQKKQRYVVTDGNHLYFKEYQEDVEIVILADEMPGIMNYVKKFDTKEEAQKVADVLGWEVEEVQE